MTTNNIIISSDPQVTITGDSASVTAVVPVSTAVASKTGIAISTPLQAAIDFNTVITPGFYYTTDTSSTNAPVASQIWYLQVDVYGLFPTTYCIQIAAEVNTSTPVTTYTRLQVNGVWGAWQQNVLLNAAGQLPASDGSMLTNVNVAPQYQNYISGLTISPSNGTNTFSVAAGTCTDSTNASTIMLSSLLTKNTGAWAAGNSNGALDTGVISGSNVWYHVHAIDGPSVPADVLISLSPTTPTLPTNYTIFRRIGSLYWNSVSSWVGYVQLGDEFIWLASVSDVAVTNLNTTSTLFTVTVPTGVQVNALGRAGMAQASISGTAVLVQSPDQNTEAAVNVPGNLSLINPNTTTSGRATLSIRTNTSAQIRAVSNQATTTFQWVTYGWIDRRGRS